jgi:phosphatidylcholine synthase
MIVFASALYFADTRMKTPDKSFSGFPACWNMFALVAFATQLRAGIMLIVVTVLTVAMFVPVKFVHPVRTVRWRPVSPARRDRVDRARRLGGAGRTSRCRTGPGECCS